MKSIKLNVNLALLAVFGISTIFVGAVGAQALAQPQPPYPPIPPVEPNQAQQAVNNFWRGLTKYPEKKYDLRLTLGTLKQTSVSTVVLNTYSKLNIPLVTLENNSRLELAVETESGNAVETLSIENVGGKYSIGSSVSMEKQAVKSTKKRVLSQSKNTYRNRLTKYVLGRQRLNQVVMSVGEVEFPQSTPIPTPKTVRSNGSGDEKPIDVITDPKPIPVLAPGFAVKASLNFAQANLKLDVEDFAFNLGTLNGKYEEGDLFTEYSLVSNRYRYYLKLSETKDFAITPIWPVPTPVPAQPNT